LKEFHPRFLFCLTALHRFDWLIFNLNQLLHSLLELTAPDGVES